jgi:hypothetical protein
MISLAMMADVFMLHGHVMAGVTVLMVQMKLIVNL